MNNTSRTTVLDWTLLIGNLVALIDHKNEEISNLEEEYRSIDSVAQNPEEYVKMDAAIKEDIAYANAERDALVDLRRELQREFFATYNIDQDYWCQFKHRSVILTTIDELRSTHANVRFLESAVRKLAYQFLGKMTGVWPANCGRCLSDMLEEKEQRKTDTRKLFWDLWDNPET